MSDLIYDDEPTTRLSAEGLDRFLMWCYDQGASDIFISTGEKLAIMKNDAVMNVGKRPIQAHEIDDLLKEIDMPASPSILVDGRPRDFQHTVMLDENPDSAARFRVSATAEKSGAEIVFRTIPSVPLSVKQLEVEEDIIKASKAEYGLVLITGPTGSGKSTLNAALLRDIAEKEAKHIITYEAPIEFDLKAIPNRKARIAQTQVPDHIRDFPTAVSNALRRKPHIILIGEARDPQTIAGCTTASQTGHLVYSTVHTNSVAMTISRMVDEFPTEERKSMSAKLVDAMRLIIHQRLVKSPNGGLTAIKEYLVFTDDIRRLLLDKLSDPKTIDLGPTINNLVHEFGQPLLRDVENKYKAGKISDVQYQALQTELSSNGKRGEGSQ